MVKAVQKKKDATSAKKESSLKKATKSTKKTVTSVNKTSYSRNVDNVKYEDAKRAFLIVLKAAGSKGVTQNEMMEQVKNHVSQELFPGGEKSGWWTKTVQLNMEAEGVVKRIQGKPLRWCL